MKGRQAQDISTLELRGISKSFFGHPANKNINLSFAAGEIVGLLGENGAGKTTLMNILFGLYQPDDGQILVNGQPVRFRSPQQALAAGIGMVHQHFMLVQNQTVAENIAAADLHGPFFFPLRRARQRIAELSSEFGLSVDPDERVFNLAAGELQRVEILKALLGGAKLLILDEPTSVLSPQEAEELFVVLRKMAAAGRIIIIISHKLEEILALCHRVVVLRKGEVTGGAPVAGADKTDLARLMVGRDVTLASELPPLPEGEIILDARELTVPGDRGELAVDKLNLIVRQNEIFGIAGVSGNGQKELAEALTGLRRAASGTILLDGQDVTNRPVKSLSAHGIAHIPEERMKFGIVPNLLLYENSVLKDYHTDDFSDAGFLKTGKIKGFAEMIVENFRVATPSIHTPLKNLSGGNIQKLILGREIHGDPTLLVAAHPTYGLDVGATEYIRSHLLARRQRGGAILLLSEDLDEILDLCDRIGVMFKGRFMGVVKRGQVSRTDLGLMMAGIVPESLKQGGQP